LWKGTGDLYDDHSIPPYPSYPRVSPYPDYEGADFGAKRFSDLPPRSSFVPRTSANRRPYNPYNRSTSGIFGHHDRSNFTGRARSYYGSVNGLDGGSDILANQDDTSQGKANTFEEPRVLILPKAHEIDLGNNSQTPHLDILQRGYRIERQRGDQQLWVAEEFEREYGIKEKAIVATLLGDKTSQVLPESLLRWFLLSVVYIRGSGKPPSPQRGNLVFLLLTLEKISVRRGLTMACPPSSFFTIPAISHNTTLLMILRLHPAKEST
jgi:hypothetical protein